MQNNIRTFRKLMGCLVLCLLAVCFPIQALALPELQGVNISSSGVLSWKSLTGASGYWVDVDGHSTMANGEDGLSDDLKKRIEEWVKEGVMKNTHKHNVTLFATDDSGEYASEMWEGIYSYTVEEVEQAPLEAEISSDGILSWSPYPGGETYWVGIDGQYVSEYFFQTDLKEKIDEMTAAGVLAKAKQHSISVGAADAQGAIFISWEGSYSYTAKEPETTVVTEPETKVTEPETTVTAGEPETTAGGSAGETQTSVTPKTDIAGASVIVANATYTGKARTPKVTVTYKGKKLKKGRDYKVAYSKNKNVGLAGVKVTGIGSFSGSKAVNFQISPKATKLKKLTGGSGKITVTWNKQSPQVSGYQIQVSLKKNFTSPKKVTVKSPSTVKKAVTGLKKQKKYYVRIRTYRKTGGATYYSAWSAVKTVTTKK